MSLVALTLNVSLGVLLVCAMMLGLRLDRRLRALRDSHSGFAKAVQELDHAAARTQDGLNELKLAAEAARTALADRIDNAQRLTERLAKLIEQAETATQAAQSAVTALPRPRLLREAIEPVLAPEVRPAPAATPRSRAVVDDDLFEAARPTLSAMAGGRR